MSERGIESAEVVLPCADLDGTLAFFGERLGFRVESVFPADDPAVVVVSGHGVRLRLERAPKSPEATEGAPVVLRIACRDAEAVAGGVRELVAPDGTRVLLVEAEPAIELPELRPEFVLCRADGARWTAGRAGMGYRDLIPGRQGGRFAASLIRIPAGGPVPDYVHFHAVRFQMIFCRAGWVRVVYEDQGEPFVLQAGDAVLQPPGIRHRVLECSDGLEVIELSSPASHLTRADHALELPTAALRPERDFGGQRFVRHATSAARWLPWRHPGFECRDLGLSAATGGLANACVARPVGAEHTPTSRHDAELIFTFVLTGTARLTCEGHGEHALTPGDTFVVPARIDHALAACSSDLELLEVTLAP